MGYSSKDDNATSGGESPPSKSSLYAEGEKVLAYHGPRIYEAKVQKAEIKKNEWRYFVHYLGWNKKFIQKNLSSFLVSAYDSANSVEGRSMGKDD